MKPLWCSLRKQADVWLFSLIGFAAIIYHTFPQSIGLTADSITYISAARSLATQHLFVEINGSPLSDFPFFYPFFLSCIIELTHIDVVVFAPVVNALLFAAVIACSACILKREAAPSPLHQWLITGIIATSPILWHLYSMLWSETLFLLEILLFIIGMKKYVSCTSLQALITVSVVVSIACITRYAGIFLIATGGILLLAQQAMHWKKKLQHLLIFTAISSLLLLANLIRNQLVSGTATGGREKGITTLHNNIVYFGAVLNGWFWHIPNMLVSALTGYGFLLVLSFVLLGAYRTAKHLATYSFLAAVVCLGYAFFIILISTLSHFEQIDSRLVVPAFIPLLLSMARPTLYGSKSKAAKFAFALIGLLILAVQLTKDTLPFTELDSANPNNYQAARWQHSPLLQYAQQHQQEMTQSYTLYSNAVEATYFIAGLHCDRLPQKINTQEISEFLEEDSICIIWFNKVNVADEISLPYILKNKALTLKKQLPDGAVYFSEHN